MKEFDSVNAHVAEFEEQVTAFNGGVAVGATTRDTTASRAIPAVHGMKENEHGFFLMNGVPRTDD